MSGLFVTLIVVIFVFSLSSGRSPYSVNSHVCKLFFGSSGGILGDSGQQNLVAMGSV